MPPLIPDDAGRLSTVLPNNTANTLINYGAVGFGGGGAFTVAFWYYPTEARNWSTFWCTDNAAGQHWMFYNATSGMYVDIKRASGAYSYWWTTRPTLNAWNFVAITVDIGAASGDLTRLYLGTPSAPATLQTLDSHGAEGSGAIVTAGDMYLGASPGEQSAGGRFGFMYVSDSTRLTLAQIVALQFQMRPVAGDEVVLSWPNGAEAKDYSGAQNHAVVTGGSGGPGVPLAGPLHAGRSLRRAVAHHGQFRKVMVT